MQTKNPIKSLRVMALVSCFFSVCVPCMCLRACVSVFVFFLPTAEICFPVPSLYTHTHIPRLRRTLLKDYYSLDDGLPVLVSRLEL